MAFWVLLRRFLGATSIHGLQYVGEGKKVSLVIRTFWLACVATGFLSAGYIITLNVVQWLHNPAVVADVSSVLVQGKKWNPRVTVCPIGADIYRLTFALLDRFPNNFTEEAIGKARGQLASHLIQERQKPRQHDVEASAVLYKFFDPCRTEVEQAWSQDDKDLLASNGTALPELSPSCEMLRVLWTFQKGFVKDDLGDWHRLKLSLVRFLTEVSVSPEEVVFTAADLDRHLSAELLKRTTASTGGELRRETDPLFPPDHVMDANMFFFFAEKTFEETDDHERLLQLYSFFFPVVEPGYGGDVHPVRGLPDLKKDVAIPVETAADLGALLGSVYSAGFPWDKQKDTQNLLLDGLAALVGEPTTVVGSFKRREMLLCHLNFYSRPDEPAVYWPGTRSRCDGYCEAQAEAADGGIGAVCEDADGLKDSETWSDRLCAGYCRFLDTVSATVKKDVAWAHLKAVGEADGIGGFLPGCVHRSRGEVENCWTKIVNEKGVCFTTDKASSLEIGRGGLREALSFAIDMRMATGPYVDYGRFTVMVSQENEFTRGRYAETEQTETVLMPLRDVDREQMVADIKVKVVSHTGTTEEFAAMSPNTRKCYYPGEKALAHFPTYSESNCVLECAWEVARVEARCVPWYLLEAFPGSDLCEMNGVKAFDRVVDDRNQLDDDCVAGCFQDCTRTEFQINTQTFTRHSTRGLADLKAMEALVADVIRNDTASLPPKFRPLAEELTAEHKRDLAAVNVYVDKNVALEITRTAATTPIDMVSAVGGTLGLFSGFSLISAVEVVYWMGKCFAGRRKRSERRQTKPMGLKQI